MLVDCFVLVSVRLDWRNCTTSSLNRGSSQRRMQADAGHAKSFKGSPLCQRPASLCLLAFIVHNAALSKGKAI